MLDIRTVFADTVLDASKIVPPTARELAEDDRHMLAATVSTILSIHAREHVNKNADALSAAALLVAEFCAPPAVNQVSAELSSEKWEALNLSLGLVTSGLRRARAALDGGFKLGPADIRTAASAVYENRGYDFPDLRSRVVTSARGGKNPDTIEGLFKGLHPLKLALAIKKNPNDPTNDWGLSAVCRVVEPEEFFVQGEAQHEPIKYHCKNCPVRPDCVGQALINGEAFGVWGSTESFRKAALRIMYDKYGSPEEWAASTIEWWTNELRTRRRAEKAAADEA